MTAEGPCTAEQPRLLVCNYLTIANGTVPKQSKLCFLRFQKSSFHEVDWTSSSRSDLALEVVVCFVVLTGQLQALIDEHLVQLAVPEQLQEVLRLAIATLTCHKR